MAFYLRIRFTGLSLFVPGASGSSMHVLMPDTKQGGAGEVHMATIEVVRGTVVPNAERPEFPLLMDHYALDLTSLKTKGSTLTLPECVVDLYPAVFKKIPRTHLERRPPDSLLTRITVPPALEIKAEPGASWTLPPYAIVEMTPQVVWTFWVDASELAWERIYLLDTSGPKPLRSVRPDGDTIELRISHVPAGETCEVPPWLYRSPHFTALYRLFPTGGSKPILLKWRDGDKPGQTCIMAQRGGSPYTCMVAQAPLKEP